MKINGVELSFDLSSPEDLTAASRFINETRAAIAGLGGDFMENTVKVHKAVSKGFDRMYGPGVGARVCGEKASGMKAVTAVCEFMEEYWRQIDQMGEVFKRTAACWDRFDEQAKRMEQETLSGKGKDICGPSESLTEENKDTPLTILPQRFSDGADVV